MSNSSAPLKLEGHFVFNTRHVTLITFRTEKTVICIQKTEGSGHLTHLKPAVITATDLIVLEPNINNRVKLLQILPI